VQQWSLGVQRSLTQNTTLELNYWTLAKIGSEKPPKSNESGCFSENLSSWTK
jgi:hypothetical protein